MAEKKRHRAPDAIRLSAEVLQALEQPLAAELVAERTNEHGEVSPLPRGVARNRAGEPHLRTRALGRRGHG